MGQAHKILIVEDEPLIAMMLGDLIGDLGHEVHDTCETLADAFSACEAGGFDLAILDIHLGGEDIWPVAQRMQEAGKPFLLASGGHIDPPPETFAAVQVLSKPYTLESLGSSLERALAKA